MPAPEHVQLDKDISCLAEKLPQTLGENTHLLSGGIVYAQHCCIPAASSWMWWEQEGVKVSWVWAGMDHTVCQV